LRRRRKRSGLQEEDAMLTFQLIGMGMLALFFGALVTGSPNTAR
jgi:hypothetical protein